MAAEPGQRPTMVYWDYGPPPAALDLVRDTLLARAVRIALHAVLRAYLRLFHRYRAVNAAQLGRLAGHLIVANHASHLDAVVLLSAFPLRRINRVCSLCAKDYFFTRPLRRMAAFYLANTIPMERERFDRPAMAYCRRRLAEGANLIVFPEGTRSPDGRLAAFKPGVGLLALKHTAPVLPAGIRGAYQCLPKGRRAPRPGQVEVFFGQAVDYAALDDCKDNWLAVAGDLHRRVAALAGQPNEEAADHECLGDQVVEGAGEHAGPAQRRRAHRPERRADQRQDGALRLSQPPVRPAADRQAV